MTDMDTMQFKRWWVLAVLCCTVLPARAQEKLSLSTCLEQAAAHAPARRQQQLQQQATELRHSSLGGNYHPQFALKGQANYLSDVVDPSEAIGENGGGAMNPFGNLDIPNFQYNVYAELNQNIYDGGMTKLLKQQNNLQGALQQQEQEVSLLHLREQVERLYFTTLLLQEQQTVLTQTTLPELQERLKEVSAKVRNGVLLPSVEDGLRMQQLRVEQQLAGVEAQRESLLQSLGILTGQEVAAGTLLAMPEIEGEWSAEAQRPEYEMFRLSGEQLDTQIQMKKAAFMPKLQAFGQYGFGVPNPLNFFEEDGSDYYMLGVRLQWKPFDFGSSKKEQQALMLQKDVIAAQQEGFDQQLSVSVAQAAAERSKYEALYGKDLEIIELQKKNVKQAAVQLDNGVITSTSYLTEVNRLTDVEMQARMNRIRVAQAQVQLLTLKGLL